MSDRIVLVTGATGGIGAGIAARLAAQGARVLAHYRTRPPDDPNVLAAQADLREPAEVDVDFALHGDLGPASRWAQLARPGDEVALLAPVATDNGGVVTLSNASAITVTVPSGLGTGFSCICIQIGAGLHFRGEKVA